MPASRRWRIEERELKKRAKYLIESKNNLWRRLEERIFSSATRKAQHVSQTSQVPTEDRTCGNRTIREQEPRNMAFGDCERDVPRERRRRKSCSYQDCKWDFRNGSAASISIRTQLQCCNEVLHDCQSCNSVLDIFYTYMLYSLSYI